MDVRKRYFIVALVAVVAFFAALYIGLSPEDCDNLGCFQENMIACSPARYINEEAEASWRYEILGFKGQECRVQVKLLLAKEGDLDLRAFEGHTMICSFEKGVFQYPDRDLEFCSGRLKEDLQGRIIEKLHIYILDNIGEIKEGLI